MEFITPKAFDRKKRKLKISEEEFDEFQEVLTINPEEGEKIKRSKYLRKARLSDGNKGESGSFRVIYFFVVKKDVIAFVDIYHKSQKIDLTNKEIKKYDNFCKELIEIL